MGLRPNFVSRVTNRLRRMAAQLAPNKPRECCVCGEQVALFLPYPGGLAGAPEVARRLDVIGSDLDHFSCPACACNDRERHLFLYFKALGLLDGIRGGSVLQFAPEPSLGSLIRKAGPQRLVQGDLFPESAGVEKMDMLAIPYPDRSFDLVIANHVLEHVSDDQAALREIHRVLRPGGRAVLQTPYSAVLALTESDPTVTSKAERLRLYGQTDHVRIFGRDIFDRFERVGLVSRVVSHDEGLPGIDPDHFGVNRREPFFLFQRREGAA